MLERCITDKGGHYLFCDTDSMCIVASRDGGTVSCPNEPPIKALSWKDVEEIANRFESLNCYDRKKVPGSILKIEKVNFDKGKQIDLFGFATSAKRYALYRYDKKGNIVIVDAKAHGLGYLFAPEDAVEDDPESDWILQAWHWVLEGEVATPRPAPEWFGFPAMMRTRPLALQQYWDCLRALPNHSISCTSPFFSQTFTLLEKPRLLGLIMPFSKHRAEWLKTKAIDTHSGKQYSISLLDPTGRTKKIEVKCYGNILGSYREHPEAKFLASDDEPCNKLTRGLLRRSHIVSNQHRYIRKETSRRWEQGDDLSLVDFHCAMAVAPRQDLSRDDKHSVTSYLPTMLSFGVGEWRFSHGREVLLCSPSAAIRCVPPSSFISKRADSFALKVTRRSNLPSLTDWSTSGFALAARLRWPCA